MPRPRKWRKVCCLPESCRFGPLAVPADDTVTMTAEGVESIRLSDLNGFTTVQGIYDSARKKLAQSLVNGKVLLIEGGEYRLCDGQGRGCGGTGCCRRRCGRHFEDIENKAEGFHE